MRLLTDHDVWASTARCLEEQEHDVTRAAEAGLADAYDVDLLAAAAQERRILVTRDRDFGGLVFVQRLGAGVIYLRITPATTGPVHEELTRVMRLYSEAELRRAFVVVEPGRHRIRRLEP